MNKENASNQLRRKSDECMGYKILYPHVRGNKLTAKQQNTFEGCRVKDVRNEREGLVVGKLQTICYSILATVKFDDSSTEEKVFITNLILLDDKDFSFKQWRDKVLEVISTV